MAHKFYECIKCGWQFPSGAVKPRCHKCKTRKVNEIPEITLPEAIEYYKISKKYKNKSSKPEEEIKETKTETIETNATKATEDLYKDKDGEPLIPKKSQSVRKKEEVEQKKEEKKEKKGFWNAITILGGLAVVAAIGYFWFVRGGFNWRKPKPEEASQEPASQEISRQAMSYISR